MYTYCITLHIIAWTHGCNTAKTQWYSYNNIIQKGRIGCYIGTYYYILLLLFVGTKPPRFYYCHSSLPITPLGRRAQWDQSKLQYDLYAIAHSPPQFD